MQVTFCNQSTVAGYFGAPLAWRSAAYFGAPAGWRIGVVVALSLHVWTRQPHRMCLSLSTSQSDIEVLNACHIQYIKYIASRCAQQGVPSSPDAPSGWSTDKSQFSGSPRKL